MIFNHFFVPTLMLSENRDQRIGDPIFFTDFIASIKNELNAKQFKFNLLPGIPRLKKFFTLNLSRTLNQRNHGLEALQLNETLIHREKPILIDTNTLIERLQTKT